MSTIETTTVESPAQRGGARVHVQKLGTSLSNMVMPNIGAFIAWGLITALFIKTGWLPSLFSSLRDPAGWVARIGGWGDFDGAGIVGPMITYLLPILIGATGGRMVHGVRGSVVGAIATMGVIAGTDIPMFMGAMIMGPLGGWVMKKVDALWDGKIRPGFEMLVDNFSAGIVGLILAVFGFFGIGLSRQGMMSHELFIEPAKVLFLNNAINHGILTPLGTTQATQTGKSILFLLEANPGPGLGLLLAYSIFGRGTARASAPGAAIIQFFGGIHEIYFPYILMKPKLIAATILGGMTGIFINVLFGSGLRAPAAPGSIIAVLAQTASDSYLGVILSVIGAATVSFLVASLLLKTDRSEEVDADLAAATAEMEAMKGRKSSVAAALAGGAATGPISNIVFACDAGMGSSAMGASVLRKKIQGGGFPDVLVTNSAISNLTDTYGLVVSHRDLTERARQKTPSALHISVDNFMNSPRYDEIVELLGRVNTGAVAAPAMAAAVPIAAGSAAVPIAAGSAAADSGEVLDADSIVLAGTATSRDAAITEAGRLLVDCGAVEPSYVDSMHEREASVSTFMGNGLAIPHGTNEAKGSIRRTAMSFVRYPEPIDWNGKPVEFVVGIAGAGQDHMALLTQIAHVFLDKDQVEQLRTAQTRADVQAVLAAAG